MVASTRRKSVSFVEPANEPPRTRRSGVLAAANSPAAKSPARSALKRSSKPPGSVEIDGGFKFKRRKNAGKSAQQDPLIPASPQPAPTPAASRPPTTPAQRSSSRVQDVPLATSPQREPQLPELTLIVSGEESIGSEMAAVTNEPAPGTMALRVEPSLSGAPPELLYALVDVCQESQRTMDSHAPLAEICIAELARTGVHAAPPTDENALLREREDLLRQRIVDLTRASEEWDAAADVEALVQRAELSVQETEAAEAEVMLDLPQPPPLDAQISALGLHLALCTDQIELTLRSVERLCAHGKEAQRRLAKTMHKQTFQG